MISRYAMAAAALALSSGGGIAPASAQVRYGPWTQTGNCRPIHAPSGIGRGAVVLPQTPGGGVAQECQWTREVQDCPRLRDKVAHPIQCLTRRETSGYTSIPPRN